MKLNNKGFTLSELLLVILLIGLLSVLVITATNRSLDKSRKRAFVAEANTITRAAISKEEDDKAKKNFSDDIYAGKDLNKVCYNIQDSLIGKYVEKDNGKKYKGSVEVCFGEDCSYNTKIWLTNGEYYVEAIDRDVTMDDIKFKFNTKHYTTCGNNIMYGGIECDDNSCEYAYTGKETKFTAPRTGTYTIEAWGAQGGNSDGVNSSVRYSFFGGYGGYSYAEITLVEGDVLYINVGGRGNDDDGLNGHDGYNGGGKNSLMPASCRGDFCNNTAGGGGATSISFRSGLLSEHTNKKDYIVMVAGGGGGAGWSLLPGNGGGIEGNPSEGMSNKGTQTSGYALGKGQDTTRACWANTAGGGGGYYGANYPDKCGAPSGGGGSGYINNPALTNAHMYGYNVTTSDDVTTKTLSGTNVSEDPIADYAKQGDGYARITYLG